MILVVLLVELITINNYVMEKEQEHSSNNEIGKNNALNEDEINPKINKKVKIVLLLSVVLILLLSLILFFSDTPASQQTETKDENEGTAIEALDDHSSESEKEEGRDVVLKDTSIDWVTPESVGNLGFFNAADFKFADTKSYYKVGEVKDGEYKGWDLITFAAPYDDLMLANLPPYIVGARKDDDFVVFDRYSTPFEERRMLTQSGHYFVENMKIADDIVIPELEFPNKIEGPKGSVFLKSRNVLFLKSPEIDWWGEGVLYEKVFRHDLGPAYTDASRRIYFDTPLGLSVGYYLEIDFYDKEESIYEIIWSDGTANEIDFHSFGGFMSHLYIWDEEIDLNADLEVIGTTTNEDPVYFPKNPDHPILREVYDRVNGYNLKEGRKFEYEEYVEDRPVFLWIDPLERLVIFTDTTYLPEGMAKPVIYLYPEKEKLVRVKVKPEDIMTVSIPRHGRGWEVLAKPTGELTDIKSGNTYPYLFWESTRGSYVTPEKGFVISREKVEDLITDKLYLFNLIESEIEDFLEYWLPFMQDSPYYFITFSDNDVMDELAPLTIEPKPDTVIRVLMDFIPLEEPTETEELTIEGQQRKGFTVVEWGGIKSER